MITKENIIKRFVSYVTIDTESDPSNPNFPSTEKQWNLAHLLEKELNEIGLEDVVLDENCYLMATLPSNIDYKVPTIGFISHIDTSPDFTGKNVNPQIHSNYDGNDIVLNKAQNIVLSPDYFDDMLQYKGADYYYYRWYNAFRSGRQSRNYRNRFSNGVFDSKSSN